jgi:hypothetical protein
MLMGANDTVNWDKTSISELNPASRRVYMAQGGRHKGPAEGQGNSQRREPAAGEARLRIEDRLMMMYHNVRSARAATSTTPLNAPEGFEGFISFEY